MNEFEFIQKLLKPLATSPHSLDLSDDIALLKDKNLAFSTDTICEDIHFLSGTSPDKIAEKLLRVNISDLASKGIIPKYYSLNLSLSKETITKTAGLIEGKTPDKPGDISQLTKKWLEKFVFGLSNIQKTYNISLLGGDTTATNHGSVFSATIFGNIKNKYITRNGAQPGDLIFVTGYLGDSFIGLNMLTNQEPPTKVDGLIDGIKPDESSGINRFTENQKPEPTSNTLEGRELDKPSNTHRLTKKHFVRKYELPDPRVEMIDFLPTIASSSMDISDGVIQDLQHILNASNCGANIEPDKLPISPEAETLIAKNKSLTKEQLISHGDDYEILFTAPAKYLEKITSAQFSFPITQIGTITEKHQCTIKNTFRSKQGFSHFV